MSEPTLSVRIRAIQEQLNAINSQLVVVLDDACHIGLAPFRLAHIRHTVEDNEHAWQELNELATALELTGQTANL